MLHLFVIAVTFLGIFWLAQKARPKLPYPPGPKGYPIIGNAHQLELTNGWLYYTKLKEKYGSRSAQYHIQQILTVHIGDIIYLSAVGQPLVILNSRKAIQDLVINKAAIFANRPRLTMCGEL